MMSCGCPIPVLIVVGIAGLAGGICIAAAGMLIIALRDLRDIGSRLGD